VTRTEKTTSRKSSIFLNPYAIVIDENRERVERGEKKRKKREAVYFFQHTCHGKMVRHQSGATRKRTQTLTLPIGYHDLGALNALRHLYGLRRCGCHHENHRNAMVN
jgi:hypothetical protein